MKAKEKEQVYICECGFSGTMEQFESELVHWGLGRFTADEYEMKCPNCGRLECHISEVEEARNEKDV